jgi:hypothetical protein
MNVMKPRRELYLQKIKELEDELEQNLIQKEQDIIAIASKYNTNVLTIAEIGQLQTEVNTLDTYVKNIVTNTQNPFLQTIKSIIDNVAANAEIDLVKADISNEINKITLFNIDPNNVDAVVQHFLNIENPQFDYTTPRPSFTPLKTEIKLAFTNAKNEMASIMNDIKTFIQETLQVDAEITKAKTDTDKQIKSLKKFI